MTMFETLILFLVGILVIWNVVHGWYRTQVLRDSRELLAKIYQQICYSDRAAREKK